MTAKETFDNGTSWTEERARLALPILLSLAKSAHKITYRNLDKEIAVQTGQPPIRVLVVYGKVLELVGQALNELSEEWQEEIPPLTILAVSEGKGEPSSGVDGFLQRYVTKSTSENLTPNNRSAMIERATNAAHNYSRWDDVAEYFGVSISGELPETEPIQLAKPTPILGGGGESKAHLALKKHIAEHPELFSSYGDFKNGTIEFRLDSGDEVDVLFQNNEQTLAVEVKTDTASQGELTRGIFQCVKYRAVLRAMYDIEGKLINVQTILVTPQQLSDSHKNATHRLNVNWLKVNKVADVDLIQPS